MSTDQLPLNKAIEDAKVANSDEIFVTVSQTALDQVNAVIQQQEKSDLFLRLYVQSSVTGISFGMALDTRKAEDDHVCEVSGVMVRIDRISFPYLNGANVDFVESEEKTGFQITSPNTDLMASAASGCGSCGGDAGCC